MSNYPTSKVVSYGLLGGFTGAIVMGAIAYTMPIPNTGGAPFFVAAAMIMGLGTLAWTAGWVMHLVMGLIVGAVFAAVIAKVGKLQPKTKGRTTSLGLVAGVVVWAVFFVPLMVTLMPALMSMTTLVAGSFVAHAIYGLVLGGSPLWLFRRALFSSAKRVVRPSRRRRNSWSITRLTGRR